MMFCDQLPGPPHGACGVRTLDRALRGGGARRRKRRAACADVLFELRGLAPESGDLFGRFAFCTSDLGGCSQLVALRLRSREFTELEIVVLRHDSRSFGMSGGRRSRSPDRAFLAGASRFLPTSLAELVLRHSGHVAVLASPPRGATPDLPCMPRPRTSAWGARAAPCARETQGGGTSGSPARWRASA
jgi:hypothetical protein